jgi:hypothetical protein
VLKTRSNKVSVSLAVMDTGLDTLELPLVIPLVPSPHHVRPSDEAEAEAEVNIPPLTIAVASVAERYFEWSGVVSTGA